MTDDTANTGLVDAAEMDRDATSKDGNDGVKNQLIDWMRKYLADLTGIDVAEIDVHSTFDRYGIDSYQGVVITHELGQWLGWEIEASDAFEHPSVAELAEFLAGDPAIRAALARGSDEAEGGLRRHESRLA